MTSADAPCMPEPRHRLQRPPPSKLKIFLRRLLSFVVLWTIVLTALFSGNRLVSDYVFLLIMVFLAATGLGGVLRAGRRSAAWFASSGWGIFGGVLLMVGTFLNLTGQLGTSGLAGAGQ